MSQVLFPPSSSLSKSDSQFRPLDFYCDRFIVGMYGWSAIDQNSMTFRGFFLTLKIELYLFRRGWGKGVTHFCFFSSYHLASSIRLSCIYLYTPLFPYFSSHEPDAFTFAWSPSFNYAPYCGWSWVSAKVSESRALLRCCASLSEY